MHEGPPPEHPNFLRRLLAKPKLLVIAVAAIGAIIVAVVVLVASIGKGKPPNQAEAARRLTKAVVEAQLTAEKSDGLYDLPRLSKALEKDLSGYVTDLDASTDRRAVGVAARPINGSVCTFAWSAVGGAKTATVSDPNLPCVGAIALIAAR